MLEYAIKKERLLREAGIGTKCNNTLISLIVFGLPNDIADRIDKGKLQETRNLHNELGRLEHLTRENKYENNTVYPKQIREKKPCQFCTNNK